MTRMALTAIKPYFRWAMIGLTLFFIAAALREHWAEVMQLRLRSQGWLIMTLGFWVTLGAHVWSGWVWGWILHDLDQAVTTPWAIGTFLVTNIAKYLPGNIWHFIGRVRAAMEQQISVTVATLSVVVEALCMAAAAIVLAIMVLPFPGAIGLGLLMIMIGLRPRWLNPIVAQLAAGKARQFDLLHSQPSTRARSEVSTFSPLPEIPEIPKHSNTLDTSRSDHSSHSAELDHLATDHDPSTRHDRANSSHPSKPISLQHYPWRPLFGELGFVILRGLGFLAAWLALAPIPLDDLPHLIGGFSFAWLLGLIIPGAPGGIGVFEATALSLLSPYFSVSVILGAIALYRLMSVATEVFGAALAISIQTVWKSQ